MIKGAIPFSQILRLWVGIVSVVLYVYGWPYAGPIAARPSVV